MRTLNQSNAIFLSLLLPSKHKHTHTTFHSHISKVLNSRPRLCACRNHILRDESENRTSTASQLVAECSKCWFQGSQSSGLSTRNLAPPLPNTSTAHQAAPSCSVKIKSSRPHQVLYIELNRMKQSLRASRSSADILEFLVCC